MCACVRARVGGGGRITDRIEFVAHDAVLLTRQSKTKHVGICDPEIQSKKFLHANQMHSPFS
jgi:hypothetical protein